MDIENITKSQEILCCHNGDKSSIVGGKLDTIHGDTGLPTSFFPESELTSDNNMPSYISQSSNHPLLIPNETYQSVEILPHQSTSCQIDNITSVPYNNTSSSNNITSKLPTKTWMLVLITEVSRLILPSVISIYYVLIRNQKIIVESLRRRLLPAIVAFLANSLSRSLSSVQAFRPSRKVNILLESPSTPELVISQPNFNNGFERSVTCEVIVEPSPGEEHRADVIFIHGLHGSLNKTWRQGTWNDKRVETGVKYVREDSFQNDLQNNQTRPLRRKRNVTLPVNCAVCCPAKKPTMTQDETNVDEKVCFNKNHVCDLNDNEDKKEDIPNGRRMSNCWPQDWLPNDCPGVRVIALNYTTDPYLWRPVWIKQRKRSSLEERSKEMIELLLEKNVGARPIIWVAHSKGGLFVKQLLIEAWENQSMTNVQNYDDIESLKISSKLQLSSLLEGFYKQSKGVMFYSVPHLGSPLAEMNLPLLRQSIELQEIQKDSPLLVELHRKFLELCNTEDFKPEIFSFIETSLTLMSIIYLKIVPFDSADPGVGTVCGVPIDHREICKPTSRDCFLYQELAELINRVL